MPVKSSNVAKIRAGALGSILLTCLAITAIAGYDQQGARKLRQAGEILPLEQIVEKARLTHPGRILEVKLELEHGVYYYEVELLDDRGRVRELHFDAGTGELVEDKLEK